MMETGKDTRRSSSINRDARDEAEKLLDAENGSSSFLEETVDDDDYAAEHQHESAKSRDRSNWLRPLGFLIAVIFLAVLSIRAASILFLQPSLRSSTLAILGKFGDGKDSLDPMVGIELHPDNHVYRSPKTINYFWTITSDTRSPDGVEKRVYLVNGEFPGPTIECQSGDRLKVHVKNELDSEAISIHWHGLNMRNANAMDGASGFTQCPVPAGEAFVYDFVVDEDQAGTFWWHAHSQVQRGDGMYGGLIVHRPSREDNSELREYGYKKEVLLLIGDWYHRSAEEVLDWYTSARGFGNEPVPDSLVVNGVGRFLCSMAVPARPVNCTDMLDERELTLLRAGLGRVPVRLRIVNVGSLAGVTLDIGTRALSPLTVDGGSRVVGSAVGSIGILYPGERIDVLLDGSKADSHAQLEIRLDPENFKYSNEALRPNQSFPILSTAARKADMALAAERTSSSVEHFDLSTAVSVDNISESSAIPAAAQETFLLYTKTVKLSIDGNHPKGIMNRTSWAPQSEPLLSLPREKWDSNQLIPLIPTEPNPIWVDIIVNNLDDGAHPFHLHGHDFYILASRRSEHGLGSYSPYMVGGNSGKAPVLNLKNPLRKDTVGVPRRGYVVLRFLADNPGIWMFHCHVLFHQASGMAMGFQVGGEESHDNVDTSAAQLCRAT